MSQTGGKNRSKEQRQVRDRPKVRRPRGKRVTPFKSFPFWLLTLPAVWGWQAEVSSSFALITQIELCSSHFLPWSGWSSYCPLHPLFLSACAHAAHPPSGPFLHLKNQHYPSVSVLSSVKVEPLHPMMASLFSELS